MNGILKRTFSILLLTLLCVQQASTCSSEETDIIYWQNVNWPPFQILHGEDAGKGRADYIQQFFQQRLPRYTHENIEMNWSRYWEGVQSGKPILNVLAIKTEERSQYALFSEVITFVLPQRIIMREETIEALGSPQSVSLENIVQKDGLRGVLETKRSYSNMLDPILRRHEDDGNFERKALDAENIIQMVLSGRVDYTIEYPFVVDYLASRLDSSENIALGSIDIAEMPEYITARVAAPKNPWGRRVIDEINAVIGELKKQEKYLELHLRYHSNASDIEKIRKIYEQVFVKP